MKKLLLLLLLVPTHCQVYSQTYDLIVKSDGDSIACHIDSITDTHIYFEMISKKHWIHTHIAKTDVSEYKQNVINRKQYVFKPGTSIIESPLYRSAFTMRDIQKNSVYVGILTLNYSRTIPGDHFGFTVAGGLSFLDGIALQLETTFLLGGTKHFFEPGIFWWHDNIDDFLLIRTGFRYQSSKGFLFRAAPLLTFIDYDFTVLPSLSIGYSF